MSKPRMLTDEQLADAELRDELVELLSDMPCDNSDDDAPICPTCHGPCVIIGTLGNVLHLRCRRCGANASLDCSNQSERVN